MQNDLVCFSRTEFKAYTDVKPVKLIKAKSQYKLLVEEKTNLETSYSATFKGEQAKPQATDNKLMDRRRIRSLYSEPSKESSKVWCFHRSSIYDWSHNLLSYIALFYYQSNEINNSRYERNHQKCNYTVRDEIVILS